MSMKKSLKITLIGLLCIGSFRCTDLDENLEGSFKEDFVPENPGVGIKNNVNKGTPNDGLNSAFGVLRSGIAWQQGKLT